MKILIIDNYDSFTYNLVHYIEGIVDDQITVVRNDEIDAVRISDFDRIVISPGPGLPSESGNLLKAIESIPQSTPVLAVCLGMQAYAVSSRNKLFNQEKIHHGVQVGCHLETTSPLFTGIEKEVVVGLYHSWAVVDELSEEWQITARSVEGVIMAMEHRSKPIFCVQFHPESVLTPQGKKMVENFLNYNS